MTVHRSIRPLFAALMAVAILAGALALAPAAGADVPAGTSTVDGTVSYVGGLPADGATVTLCNPPLNAPATGYGCSFGGTTSITTVAPSGAYSFPNVLGARYQLVVTPAPGQLIDSYAVITFGPDFVVAEGATATHPITLAQGGKVSGRIVDAGANPIETTVTICPTGYPGSFCEFLFSEPDGTFTSTRAFPGPTANVIVGAPASPSGLFGITRTVSLSPAATTATGDIQLDSGGTVSGFVQGPSGEAVAGASVSITALAAGCGPCTGTTTSGADGAYSIASPSGNVNVNVAAPPATTYVGTTVFTTVAPGATTSLDVSLSRPQISVTISAVNGALGGLNAPVVCAAPAVVDPTGVNGFAPCVLPDATRVASVGAVVFPSTGGGAYSISGVPTPGRYEIVGASVVNFSTFGFLSSPAVVLDVAPGDTITCAFVVDMSGGAGGTSSCSGATGTPPGGGNTATLPPVSGGGSTTITSPVGTTLTAVSAVDPGTVGGGTLPAGVTLPFGAYAFTINGVTPGGSADVTVTYPATNPAPNGYAKVVGGVWTDASSLIVAQGGGSTTIRLTDGGPFDTNPAPGVIGDPGGPAVVDETAPTVGLTGPADGGTYTLGAVPTAGCTATDEPGGSGVGDPACTVSVSGGNANGVGTFTATAAATDLAGNTASVTRTYRVVYAVDALRVPFSKVLATSPVAGAGVAGVPFPVSVTARRADGSIVTPVSARWVEPVKAGSVLKPLVTTGLPSPVTTASSFTRASDGSMSFLWRTTRSQGLSYWRIGVTLDDGTTHTVIVALL